jgi:hypothetical protein
MAFERPTAALTPTADATKRSERYGAKILQANSLRPAHPKPPNLKTARESPPPRQNRHPKETVYF